MFTYSGTEKNQGAAITDVAHDIVTVKIISIHGFELSHLVLVAVIPSCFVFVVVVIWFKYCRKKKKANDGNKDGHEDGDENGNKGGDEDGNEVERTSQESLDLSDHHGDNALPEPPAPVVQHIGINGESAGNSHADGSSGNEVHQVQVQVHPSPPRAQIPTNGYRRRIPPPVGAEVVLDQNGRVFSQLVPSSDTDSRSGHQHGEVEPPDDVSSLVDTPSSQDCKFRKYHNLFQYS